VQKTIQKNIFIIAEIANSHEGKLSEAKKIIKAAANGKANAVKIQKIIADELAEPDHEYYSLYQKLQMSEKHWKELIFINL
jgi:sialic acid synthase SpsE